MILLTQYFGKKIDHPDCKPEYVENAKDLLRRVNALYERLFPGSIWIDPDTNTQISGSKGGDGDGGFRLPLSKTGAPSSSHKKGNGIDPYDPYNTFDNAITDELLEEYGLWREHPDSTPGWCHLQRTPYGSWVSGKTRTFRP